jgi:hypothetical protein
LLNNDKDELISTGEEISISKGERNNVHNNSLMKEWVKQKIWNKNKTIPTATQQERWQPQYIEQRRTQPKESTKQTQANETEKTTMN